ncbi:hypothetical protein SK128_000148 [Halocaridina rubra]|uniref:Uncharacterized protein n=1 Tax=Halocaridina rubra TaxID=373956 RepID=A0AAN8XD74_HALRR
MRYDDSCRSRRKIGAGSVPGGAVVSSLSDDDPEDEDDPQAAGNSGGAVAGSQRAGQQVVYFPATTSMDFHQKLMWDVKLCKSHKDFEVLFKDCRYRPYITVKDRLAVGFLTTKCFEGTVLEMPDGREKYTKVITFDVPTYLSPENLAFDDRFMWIKRCEVKIKDHTTKRVATEARAMAGRSSISVTIIYNKGTR